MTVTLELTPEAVQTLHDVTAKREVSAQQMRDALSFLAAQISTPPKEASESDLLLQINALGLPETVWKRYDALLVRRRNETLTKAEHAELLELIARIENNHVEQIRLTALIARLQNKSLPVVVQEMGLGPRPVPFV